MGEDLLLLTAEAYSVVAVLAALTVSTVFAGAYTISPPFAVATARAVLTIFFSPINQKDHHDHQNRNHTNRYQADCPAPPPVHSHPQSHPRRHPQEPLGYNLQDLLDLLHHP